jgi:hypothetical protein
MIFLTTQYNYDSRGDVMHGSLQSLQAVIDSIEAIVYLADMKTYEILLINNYTCGLFGDVQGRKCWASLQQGQTGPCDFRSNSRLLSITIGSWEQTLRSSC